MIGSGYFVQVLDYKLCHHTSFCLAHHQTDKDTTSIWRDSFSCVYLFITPTVRSSLRLCFCPCLSRACANSRPWHQRPASCSLFRWNLKTQTQCVIFVNASPEKMTRTNESGHRQTDGLTIVSSLMPFPLVVLATPSCCWGNQPQITAPEAPEALGGKGGGSSV